MLNQNHYRRSRANLEDPIEISHRDDKGHVLERFADIIGLLEGIATGCVVEGVT